MYLRAVRRVKLGGNVLEVGECELARVGPVADAQEADVVLDNVAVMGGYEGKQKRLPVATRFRRRGDLLESVVPGFDGRLRFGVGCKLLADELDLLFDSGELGLRLFVVDRGG